MFLPAVSIKIYCWIGQLAFEKRRLCSYSRQPRYPLIRPQALAQGRYPLLSGLGKSGLCCYLEVHEYLPLETALHTRASEGIIMPEPVVFTFNSLI